MREYQELKFWLFIALPLLGIYFLCLGPTMIEVHNTVLHTIAYLALTLVGIACVFFGIMTLIIRNDPDLWR